MNHYNDTHRIRSLIPHLEYGTLRKKRVLPTQALFTGIKRGGKFPSLTKKIGYPQFGLFIDHMIQRALSKAHDLPYEFRDVSGYRLYCTIATKYFNNDPIERRTYHTVKPYCKEISRFVTDYFNEAKEISFEPEWIYENITGHPDLVIDNVVFDIKTTGQFGSMRISTIFQVLSYYCLAQQLNKNIDSVGLVLPAQKKILIVNLNNWDWKPFWEVLRECITTKLKLQPNPKNLYFFLTCIKPYVGSHVPKNVTIHKSLNILHPHLPWQFFLGGRARAKFKTKDSDIAKTLALVSGRGYQFYIHSPYTLNLSREEHDGWTVNCLIKQLVTTVAMGGKGVVVHCGNRGKLDQEMAYQNMLTSVIQASEMATEECPLLIETSAGETGELLSDPVELAIFYNSLPKETKQCTKICVDTCHVFVAGHDPMEFIEQLEEANVPIGLVHYNDSKGPKGCRKDRHARIGSGYIDLTRLIAVGMYAIERNIPLVNE